MIQITKTFIDKDEKFKLMMHINAKNEIFMGIEAVYDEQQGGWLSFEDWEVKEIIERLQELLIEQKEYSEKSKNTHK